MFKLKRDLVPLSVIICLLATLCFVFAQETLTITTYYPSPYGSYQDLETGNLTFRRSTDGLVRFNYNTTTYNRRLRITAGLNDSGNNDQGASIDLHGVNATTYLGRLDLVAGRGSNVTFWSSPAGSNATERMRITDAGNVGIGTIGSAIFRVAIRGSDDTASNFSLFTGGLSSTAFVARNDGNVGIGTTSPNSILDITSANPQPRITWTNTANWGGLYFYENAIVRGGIATVGSTYSDPLRRNRLEIGSVNGPMAFSTNGTERVTIDTSGNVGIGTTPIARLDVLGTVRATGVTTPSSGEGVEIIYSAPDGWIVAYDRSTSTYRNLILNGSITILANGNVGIGRAPTAYRLEVEGNASKTVAGSWLANSDIRIKTDIQDIENALGVINKLHPVKFRYSEEYRAKHSSIEDNYYYNFIAQEFQEVFPDSVKDDGEGFLQIDTHNIKPYLVAAMQELCKQIKELRVENEALKVRIDKLGNNP